MNDQLQILKDDLAFMRALAHEGQSTPIVSGSIMAAAGGIWGLASLTHWAMAKSWISGGPGAYPVIWIVATVAFVVALTVLKRRAAGVAGAQSALNKAINSAWTGVGMAITTIIASIIIASYTVQSEILIGLLPSVVFALYGMAWLISGRMSGKAWLTWVACGSFLFALGCSTVINSPDLFLVYALGLVLLALVPGLYLMRQEPKDIV